MAISTSAPPEDTLKPFFAPAGVAVVGASQDPTKLGYALARNLERSGFGGAIHFVSRKKGRLFGKEIFTSIASVPDPVDLAVLIVPSQTVPETLQECGERGIPAAIIASGGFRETGEEGAALERRCLRVAQAYGIRLLGPNCIGVIDTHLPLDTSFLPPPGPPRGSVAFLSHSGAICAAVVDMADGLGFGLSRLISLGNQLDVTETDLLVPVAEEEETRVLALYLEGFVDGSAFLRKAEHVVRKKPIVALKVGRSEAGRRAAASHTGALAGREAAVDAAFRRAGVLRADTTEALFSWSRALSWCPLPDGPNVAIVTNAGGPGVAAADAVTACDLQVAALSTQTKNTLRDALPPAASVANPIDLLASASPADYATALGVVLHDDKVDAALIILPPPPASTAGAVARALLPVIESTHKPVLVTLMGHRLIGEAATYLRASRVPDYRFPEQAVEALSVLWRRAAFLKTSPASPPDVRVNRQAAMALIASSATGFLSSEGVRELLACYGIATPKADVAVSADDAVRAAERLGYPVALKVESPDLPHKSDFGGVLLDVVDADAVRAGFERLTVRAGRAHPDASMRGVQVQKMVADGLEVIVGAVRDAQFGPMVMFGAGGVEVEGLRDVSFALAPLPHAEADRVVDSTWAGRRLQGYRSVQAADRSAAIDVLIRLAQLVCDLPQIEEIEINPLLVRREGEGAVAVDVRVRVDKE